MSSELLLFPLNGDLAVDVNADSGADLAFKSQLWEAADRMRGHMDPAEYKHIALGLIFLKYISDSFEERRQQLLKEADQGADPEDRDEYLAENVFWVPKEARWDYLQGNAKRPDIGKLLDEAMLAIERENTALKGVLPKEYGRPSLDSHRLGELIDKIGSIGLGDAVGKSSDTLGRVYEYFLARFAGAEGKRGGEFYTPPSIVKLLVEMIEPYKGRVYDPCCGSAGMFVQSEEFVRAHGGQLRHISVFGQESNHTTWRLAKMNMAIRGIEANLGPRNADSFGADLHPDLKADFILANPPFNMSYWGGATLKDDARWKFGTPSESNANFAWVQHMIHHLAPDGIAGFVLANGSMSSTAGGEGDIRRNIIEADLVDCMVALPPQLFYGTQIPACLWFLRRGKNNASRGGSDRTGHTLFIDARNLGHLINRTQREFSSADIKRVTGTYHAWRGQKSVGTYTNIPGFCFSANRDEIATQDWILTPGRYVGSEAVERDSEPFKLKMARLNADLEENFARSANLEIAIRRNLRGLL